MRLTLDPRSPLPLYHQLAESLRYRIATGALEPGTALPSLRDAARRWGVNLHTVRHAYASLAAEGLVRTQAPHGTVILARRARPSTPDVSEADRFLARMVREAGSRFGLTPAEIRQRLVFLGGTAGRTSDVAYVIECSETQAADLALQVSADWNVAAQGWSLDRPGDAPAGVMVATYFHYNDIRTRWPERAGSVHFVAIHPDPALAGRLQPFRRRGRRIPVLVCERDAAMAGNIAADLRAVLPSDGFELRPTIVASPGSTLTTAASDTPVLFSPRAWGALSPASRADPRAIEIRYLIEPRDLRALGQELDWEPRESRSTQPVSQRRAAGSP